MAYNKSNREIEFGIYLAENRPEMIWGWGSPAGKVRAKRRAQLIIKNADLTDSQVVVEIGCGNGNFTNFFSKTGAYINALDISPELINMAKQHAIQNERVNFLCQRFEDYQPKCPVQAVIGSSVLHHLDLKPSLQNIYQILEPGGRIAFAEPNFLNPQIFAERTFLRPFLAHVSPDETAFTRCGISRKLSQAGFTNVNVTPFDWLHPAVPKKFIPIVLQIGIVLEKIPIVKEFSGSLLITAQKPID